MATYTGIIGEQGNAGALERFRTLSARAKDQETRISTLEAGGDSGWQTVSSLLSGWANSGVAGDVVSRYRKLRGVVYVEVCISGGTFNNPAFLLPTGYRPSATIWVAGTDSGGSNVSSWKIDATGNVTPVTGAGVVRVTVSYPADQ